MSLVTSVIGGIQGGHAAGQAANAEVGAAQEAANTVNATNESGNALISGAGGTAATMALGAGDTAIGGVNAAAADANSRLDPYASAGSTAAEGLKAGVTAGGQFNTTPTLDQLQLDPGYAFREQQGELAIQRSAAAHGASQSGAAAKDLMAFGQADASQEYQNAFARFQTNRQNNFNDLMGVSNAGQVAATQQGTNLNSAAVYSGNAGINTNEFAGGQIVSSADRQAANSNAAANYIANTQLEAGNARASGIIGKQNSYNNMLTGIGQAVDNVATTLVNPATTFVGPRLDPTIAH
jgi:hypothetical protein